jgi:hypothetical protein
LPKVPNLKTLLLPWLTLSVIWFGIVGYRTWHDIPLDDWLSEPSGSQLSDAVNLLLYNPVGRAVVADSIVLAIVPPTLVLACAWALIWAVRKFRSERY